MFQETSHSSHVYFECQTGEKGGSHLPGGAARDTLGPLELETKLSPVRSTSERSQQTRPQCGLMLQSLSFLFSVSHKFSS